LTKQAKELLGDLPEYIKNEFFIGSDLFYDQMSVTSDNNEFKFNYTE